MCQHRWALRPFPLLAFLSIGGVFGQDVIPPFPAEEDCPTCKYGFKRCSRNCGDVSSMRAYYFDFSYHSGHCWEEIPAGDAAVMLDLDVWCIEPTSMWFMNCSNMYDFVFEGVSMLGSCVGTAMDSALAKESCYWQCKNMRPAARCKWEFDHQNTFDTQKRIDACWIDESCSTRPGRDIEVSIACKPHDGVVSQSDHNFTQDQLEQMKQVVAQSKANSTSMAAEMAARTTTFASELKRWQALLEQEEEEHNKTKEELLAARGKLGQANEDKGRLTMGIVGVAGLCLLVIGLAAVCGFVVYRRWRRMYTNGADSDAGTVVVGRPVDAESGLDGDGEPHTGHAIGNAYGNYAVNGKGKGEQSTDDGPQKPTPNPANPVAGDGGADFHDPTVVEASVRQD